MARKTGHLPTYNSWAAMKQRCDDPNASNFHLYGGRGVTYCERWASFDNFFADMGERPEGKNLDRWPNKDGNYEPGNCRWATPPEQNRNLRTNRLLTFQGRTQTVTDWAHEIGLDPNTVHMRLVSGWPVERALTPGDVRDLTGKRYGHLTVVHRCGTNLRRAALWDCDCDCGGADIVSSEELQRGFFDSCGDCREART